MFVKVMELIGESERNWKDAVQNAVMQASKTGRNVTGVEIYNLTAAVDDGDLVEFKANVKVAYNDETL